MTTIAHSMVALAEALESRWKNYLATGGFDLFVEFTLSLNGLAEQLGRQQLPGLVRACQELENSALAMFGNSASHPIGPEQAESIEHQVRAIVRELHRLETPAVITRRLTGNGEDDDLQWNKPRQVYVVSRPGHPWSSSLNEQLSFFGFRVKTITWEQIPQEEEMPLAVIFVPEHEGADYPEEAVESIRHFRKAFPVTYFYCLSVPSSLEAIVKLQRAGADVCVPAGNRVSDILSRILDLVQAKEHDLPRVLIVEDSSTAVAHITRSLSQHGIDSQAISDPRSILESTADYRPDVILMDMYMPFCTGVEVTRALRQIREYQATPVVYLSSETDIAQQVEALRLGGDQFLTKPVNPVILAAVVKTKIERYRDMLHSGMHDSLTGLLNHTASKSRLDQLVRENLPDGQLSVAMIDIDRFKLVNDTYGHPVGDQVIRGLAWLLRGRMRSTDMIGRYGGEEFIIALPGASLERAVILMESIREDFSKLPHAHALGTLRSTFSCGVASLRDFAFAAGLIEAADSALLQAKRNGRNRVVAVDLVADEEASA